LFVSPQSRLRVLHDTHLSQRVFSRKISLTIVCCVNPASSLPRSWPTGQDTATMTLASSMPGAGRLGKVLHQWFRFFIHDFCDFCCFAAASNRQAAAAKVSIVRRHRSWHKRSGAAFCDNQAHNCYLGEVGGNPQGLVSVVCLALRLWQPRPMHP